MKPRLSRVVLYVKDAAASARWYGDRFGFPTKFQRLEEGWIELDAGGCTLAFHTVDNPAEWRPEIAITVDDPPAAAAALSAQGTDIGPRMSEWQHYQWCKGRDPDGQTFQVINPPTGPATDERTTPRCIGPRRRYTSLTVGRRAGAAGRSTASRDATHDPH